MDEAEALSTKMGIMVKGGIFKCFGSAQHIKNKFGTGYVIEIKIKTLEQELLQEVHDKYYADNVLNLEGINFDEKV
jgi:ABC-type multidrug transport system ATPase subunit